MRSGKRKAIGEPQNEIAGSSAGQITRATPGDHYVARERRAIRPALELN